MNKIVRFLKDAKVFYIATVEGDQPRVRPFGVATEFKGKIYIATNNTKPCFKQMKENSKVEISGMAGDKWIRLAGEVEVDSSEEARKAMLDDNPTLKKMYSLGDGIFEVLYFKRGTASICSFTEEPVNLTIE